MRIAKYISNSGLCSRRDAEKLIGQNQVKVNGTILKTPAFNVDGTEYIEVKGKRVQFSQVNTRIWLYHKPARLLVTHNDPSNRPTVFEALPSSLPRVLSIGRLDMYSEGLLLLTNDSSMKTQLESPASSIERVYRVCVTGSVSASKLSTLQEGVTVNLFRYKPIDANLDEQNAHSSWLTLKLSEGKNREIRNIMQHFNLGVRQLIRVSFGPFSLGGLAVGELQELNPEKIALLKQQLRQQEPAGAAGKTACTVTPETAMH